MTEPIKMDSFSSDRPIENEETDRFQRSDFAKRLVRLVKARGHEDCLVVGLYGTWGEGKTSVIRILDKLLTTEQIATTYRFNPWTYKEENTLLRDFFHGLAKVLQHELLKPGQKLTGFLKKYGGVLSSIPYVGDALEGATQSLDDVSAEELKQALADGLRTYPKPIVIFLDDIDRLSREEVHAVFRLVKLTGDLPNVTYVLCFDDEMVAAAIGDRFGQGGISAGRDFLEKVIQVPLRLPRIPVHGECGLKSFALDELQKVLTNCGVDLSEEQVAEFRGEFDSAIVPALITPREVIRYANALSFTLPMLHGEVNTVDLMLFEAIRVFYPGHHKFISDERDMFLASFSKPFKEEQDQEKIKRFKHRIDELGRGLSTKADDGVRKLIEHLFPRTSEAFNGRNYVAGPWKKWYKEQRIASPEYFQRYLSYTVPKGELQDLQLVQELSEIGNERVDAGEVVKRLVQQSSHREFLRKLDARIPDMEHVKAQQLATAIVRNANLFPEAFTFMNLGFDSPRRLAANATVQLVMRVPQHEQRAAMKSLITSCEDFDMAMAIEWDLGDEERKGAVEQALLTTVQTELRAIAIARSEGRPFFVAQPNFARRLLHHWSTADAAGVRDYVDKALLSDHTAAIALLKSLTPEIRSTSHPEPYLTDFTKADFDKCVAYCDCSLLSEKLREDIGLHQDLTVEPIWYDRDPGQSDINIARQFMHWQRDGIPPS
ncbi:MAG: hypothetical protein JNN32_05645 [Flavobacteriales bacterium]|nr:hypothetical protein [Flavobacteriales bacterium]